jgi:pimeloyl-ACP methyl ester carboxylesterase
MPVAQKGYFTACYVSSLDDSEQPFAVWVPRGYTRRKKYPVLIALHGSDADHRMIPERCFRIPELGFREDLILLSPYGRGELGFQWAGEADLWDALNWLKARYRIDERRQYLTGLSIGAAATWRLACAYPEQWAAIAPVCGWGDPDALAALRDVPVWCVHGQRDELVSVAESREMVQALERLKCYFRYDELPGWGHNSWEWLYDGRRKHDHLADWLLRFRRTGDAPAIMKPRREGNFFDLFKERLIISYPAQGLTHHETELLRDQAEQIARLRFGDFEMRSGAFRVKADAELTPDDLKTSNHLMLGRTDNHRWLRQIAPQLIARHYRGRLRVLHQYLSGKSIIAAIQQRNPWNPQRLLGVLTYQQYHHMQNIGGILFDPEHPMQTLNVYDLQQGRFVLQARASYNSSSRSA